MGGRRQPSPLPPGEGEGEGVCHANRVSSPRHPSRGGGAACCHVSEGVGCSAWLPVRAKKAFGRNRSRGGRRKVAGTRRVPSAGCYRRQSSPSEDRRTAKGDAADGTRRSDVADGTRRSDAADGTRRSDGADGTRKRDGADVHTETRWGRRHTECACYVDGNHPGSGQIFGWKSHRGAIRMAAAETSGRRPAPWKSSEWPGLFPAKH